MSEHTEPGDVRVQQSSGEEPRGDSADATARSNGDQTETGPDPTVADPAPGVSLNRHNGVTFDLPEPR